MMETKFAGAGTNAAPRTTGGVRLRTVALPVEHGGWGFTLEPVVLGLALAPSVPALLLAAATLGAFLARHPLRLVLSDRRRGRRFPRTRAAERFVLLYGGAAAAAFFGALLTAPDYTFLLPLAAAAPLASVQVVCDWRGVNRSLAGELAGALSMALVATAAASAYGWEAAPAWALSAYVAARAVPSILYVRAWRGLMRPAPGSTAKRVGVLEILYGALAVAAYTLGHYTRL